MKQERIAESLDISRRTVVKRLAAIKNQAHLLLEDRLSRDESRHGASSGRPFYLRLSPAFAVVVAVLTIASIIAFKILDSAEQKTELPSYGIKGALNCEVFAKRGQISSGWNPAQS